MSEIEDTKPYGPPYPTLKEGDYVGWQDEEGTLHVERFKRWTPDGMEVEPLSDPVQRACDAIMATLDGLREIVGDDQS